MPSRHLACQRWILIWAIAEVASDGTITIWLTVMTLAFGWKPFSEIVSHFEENARENHPIQAFPFQEPQASNSPELGPLVRFLGCQMAESSFWKPHRWNGKSLSSDDKYIEWLWRMVQLNIKFYVNYHLMDFTWFDLWIYGFLCLLRVVQELVCVCVGMCLCVWIVIYKIKYSQNWVNWRRKSAWLIVFQDDVEQSCTFEYTHWLASVSIVAIVFKWWRWKAHFPGFTIHFQTMPRTSLATSLSSNNRFAIHWVVPILIWISFHFILQTEFLLISFHLIKKLQFYFAT